MQDAAGSQRTWRWFSASKNPRSAGSCVLGSLQVWIGLFLHDAAVTGLIFKRKCGWFFGSGTERSSISAEQQSQAWACRKRRRLLGAFAGDCNGDGPGSAESSDPKRAGADECDATGSSDEGAAGLDGPATAARYGERRFVARESGAGPVDDSMAVGGIEGREDPV